MLFAPKPKNVEVIPREKFIVIIYRVILFSNYYMCLNLIPPKPAENARSPADINFFYAPQHLT